jgi:hypothetical protein
MDLASKNPTGGPNCDARHDATDIASGHFARLPSSLRPWSPATHGGQPVGAGSAQIRRSIERLGCFLTHRVSPVLAGFLVRNPSTSGLTTTRMGKSTTVKSEMSDVVRNDV